jgi:hypothetical protein
MKGPFAIQCNYCRSISKNKSDFYRHLSERHFKSELARELPQQPPYNCPLSPCTYSGKETLTALVKHYGIVHKGVQKYLNGQIAGRYEILSQFYFINLKIRKLLLKSTA